MDDFGNPASRLAELLPDRAELECEDLFSQADRLLNDGLVTEAVEQGDQSAVIIRHLAKVIGPSLTEISKIYKEQNASIVSFLKQEGKPIVDPSQYDVMKANFAITKAMSDDDLKALEAYVLSF